MLIVSYFDDESSIPNVQIDGQINNVVQKNSSNNNKKAKEVNDFSKRRQSVKLNTDKIKEEKKKKCC